MRYLEGGFQYKLQRGPDSMLRNPSENYRNPYLQGVIRIQLGRVLVPEIEPVYKEATAMIETEKGWIIPNCIWPGPSVETNASGTAGGSAKSIHGLYVAPVPGQQVAIGFVGGNKDRPIVLNTYTHQFAGDPGIYQKMHNLPLTNLMHNGSDIVLGHYSGAYIALRALPLPGAIEIVTQTGLSIKSGPAATPTEPMLLGDKTKDKIEVLFDKLVELIGKLLTHTHSSAIGPTGPMIAPESTDLLMIQTELTAEQSTLDIIQSLFNENN